METELQLFIILIVQTYSLNYIMLHLTLKPTLTTVSIDCITRVSIDCTESTMESHGMNSRAIPTNWRRLYFQEKGSKQHPRNPNINIGGNSSFISEFGKTHLKIMFLSPQNLLIKEKDTLS